jgi:hypothetical protein
MTLREILLTIASKIKAIMDLWINSIWKIEQFYREALLLTMTKTENKKITTTLWIMYFIEK